MLNTQQSKSVLVIDSNETTLRLYENFLQPYFTTIHLLKETRKAFTKLSHKSFDLIIVNYTLKEMNGLAFIEKLHTITTSTIPIILSAYKEDNVDIFRSLNLRIAASLLKPFDERGLIESVEHALSIISSDNIKYDYHHSQEKRAFLKEHQSIKNDFYYQYYRHENEPTLWYLDGSYRPFDILSGDTYSIRQLDDNRCFFFIIDAMGKGVSASVTSIVASSYINHAIDKHKDHFELKHFINTFNTYIIKNLLDEEVLSVIFAELNFSTQELKTSSYAMPSILLCDHNKILSKIKSNNQPISKYNTHFNIQTHDISTMEKMLFCSDGLIESSLNSGELYFNHLKEDFINSRNRFDFTTKLYEKIQKPNDDITMLYFKKRTLSCNACIRTTSQSTIQDVSKRIDDFHLFLKEQNVSSVQTAKLGMIFTEMIMNAYEHGNLGISNAHKKTLLLEGKLFEECQKREVENREKIITISYVLINYETGRELVFEIEDEGEGFDTKIFKKLIFDTNQVNGRGFKIAKKMVDSIYYSPKGNHVIIHKYIPKET